MRRALIPILLAAACSAPTPPRSALGARGEARRLPGVVVDWKDGTTKAQFDAEERAYGLDLELNSAASVEEVLTLARDVEASDALLARLRANPLVEHAEPLFAYDALFVPDDPDFKLQWHLQQVGAERAWEWGAGAEVVVAVIDTGVARLADLASTRFVEGYDFVNDRKDAIDDNGHGSHVAGTIAQSTHNGAGVAGLAHRAAIMPVKVLGASGGGNSADIADAIRWSVDHGAKVLNLSLGGGGFSQVMQDAVTYAVEHGAFVACAAGNGYGPPVNFPAAYDGAFAVSAIRFDRQLAPYSSYGPEVDLAGPGGDTSVDQNKDGHPDGVLQQTLGGEYRWFQGTSMATPHVAAAAALLAGAGVTRVEAIGRILQDSATKLTDREKFGAGALDAGEAMRHVRLFGAFWRLGIALMFAFFAVRIVRKREGMPEIRFAFAGTLLLASAGLIALPLLGQGHSAPAALFAAPLPEWGAVLHGTQTSSPLWLSAFIPFLALGAARWKPIASAMAGIALGWAAYLAHAAAAGWVDLAFIPGRPLEVVWLVTNAFIAFLIGALALRATRRQGL